MIENYLYSYLYRARDAKIFEPGLLTFRQGLDGNRSKKTHVRQSFVTYASITLTVKKTDVKKTI